LSRSSAAGAVWLTEKGPGYPLVLSCRARLARNIDGIPFPAAASSEELEMARGMVMEAVSRRVAEERDWDIKFAEELSTEQLLFMAEEHLISKSFGGNGGRAVAMSWSEARAVTANEEDHLRIHAILPGAQFKEAWRIADKIDSRLEGQVQYCFDSRLGYLTACPSNVGTGLRVSAMIHLPALVASGEIAKTISALGAAGVYVRGLYGEGSGVAGNIFQISNRKTLGQTEEALVAKMERVVGQVIDNEKTARKMLLRESPLDVKDGVYRSLGVLERARKVNFFEALEMLSMVKMGLEMEILPISDFNMLEAGVLVSPGHIAGLVEGESGEEDIERERAVQVRRFLGI
jgi:protein arginine kinase